MRVDGARVLVTGASSGIGRALAVELAGRGARLAVVARRTDLLEALADELAGRGLPRPHVLTADLSQRGAAAALADDVRSALGDVDVLVNNAGVGVGGTQWVVGDRDEAREAFEVNLWSPLALHAAFLPSMRGRQSGAIVNVTSISQLMPTGGLGHYGATKAALAAITETLRQELAGSGVHVVEAVVGPTDTAMQGEVRLIPGLADVLRYAPTGKPAVLARLVADAVERGRPRVVYPRPYWLLYQLPFLVRATSPRLAKRLLAKAGADLLADERVVRSGSFGDPEAREARQDWERQRGRAPR